MAGCNEEKCLCPHKECANHGKCCQCVNSHRDRHNLPMCLRIMLKNQEKEKTQA